jgi:hypothetical protein
MQKQHTMFPPKPGAVSIGRQMSFIDEAEWLGKQNCFIILHCLR